MPPPNPPSTKDDEGVVKVCIDKTFTDGDINRWPTESRFEREDPRLYLLKLANMWMKARGEARPGKQYILDQLPEGYVYMSRARQQNPELRDKYLYGHPSGYYYNSPNRFWPHFYYLMTHGATPCGCDICKAGKQAAKYDDPTMAGQRRKPGPKPKQKLGGVSKSANGAGNRFGRPQRRNYLAEDEEGTPDVFKILVSKLKERGSIDQSIKEPLSMDWRAQRNTLQEHLTRTFMQHSFIPRLGELVLWCYSFQGTELKFNWVTEKFEVYCRKTRKFLGTPEWRAGTVAQTAEEPPVLEDIVTETKKRFAVNISGFRIETFPDPNSTDKNLSRQYKYVPLNCIRPLNYWQIFLQGVLPDDYHPSIKNALTVMPSCSVVDKYHFKGTWPDATVYCRGIFIGSEFLIKGDGVRLTPRSPSLSADPYNRVTDVLVIESIQVKLRNCDADLASPLLCQSTAVRLVGKAYTLSPKNAYREPDSTMAPRPLSDEEVINSFECVGMSGYGTWYRMQPEKTRVQISLDHVVGRCYESEVMSLMFDDISLGIDLEGVTAGREYGRLTDQRLAPGKEWFFGDTRVETLALESLNLEEVGIYDDMRDPKMFRANLHIIDGNATGADIRDAKIPRAMGRPPRAGLIGGRTTSSTFEKVGKMTSLVTSALGPLEASANQTPMDLTSAAGSDVSGGSESSESDDLQTALQQIPLIRGGTEESEGGDYRPSGSKPKKAKYA
ncbi:hypothetical protein, variant [Blastomyces dermatitidis ER-3]|uniref:Cryptic loci regulator 2 N-terminal domain-containing protein n=1 Tax=Ajellomyces dermatitidis (strain ER-3 / ATCC MYA-2586) TaxID=559297 RepID=A0ABX2VRI3_AJEDR|nr:uncharacterized protein BDCG_01416 [Blastomyces dermatitidis ER-3]XP_045279577.1 hypothetical protein, variant [Blastomyces dermatitidis ER-3]OAS99848.1 hypothetical protein BDCG_01416 [Blastomyces dermatitidis ER-3]OAS99849.1 hypothetical protein, variant [Blastomyces dermatitidis ER-3]